jgi:hypothetical protein
VGGASVCHTLGFIKLALAGQPESDLDASEAAPRIACGENQIGD